MPDTFRLTNDIARHRAIDAVRSAPGGYIVKITEPNRNAVQNDKFHAMVGDILKAAPGGRVMNKAMWKAAIMHSAGKAFEALRPDMRFVHDLEFEPFPIGLSTSKLSVAQFRDLIEFTYSHFTPLGVVWSEPNPYEGMDRV